MGSQMFEEKKLVKQLHLEEVQNPAFSVVIGHKYTNHKYCRWCVPHSLQYNMLQSPASYNLKDTVLFPLCSEFCYTRKGSGRFKKRGKQQGTAGDKNNNKYNKGQTKNKGSVTVSKISIEASNWYITAANIPH